MREESVHHTISTERAGAVGRSAPRPDGTLKVTGQFAYSSDLWVSGTVWGTTLRSPHAAARIRSVDVRKALALDGVHAVLTHEDVPGAKTYGMKVADQPVLAVDEVRYQGEPVALVAADDPHTAKRAAALVQVDYELLEPVTDAERALEETTRRVHPDGNLVRHVKIRHGDVAAARARADVVVSGEYEVGMQDQAFLGPESGLALPTEDGGVELHVSSQWLHKDLEQIAPCLGLPAEKVRLTLAGVGGAFGGREDLSVHVHACMLALRLGKPVKMVYDREESFFGHVHRHPAKMRFEHGATRDGKLVHVKAELVMDGGAYTSTSPVVIANACYFVAGAYEVPNAEIDGFAVFSNNPPCGAMRGFGAVQSTYGCESNMDKLARELGMDPLELRMRNAMTTGTVLPTGQAVDGPAPVAELLADLRDRPLPPPGSELLPGGLANTSHGEGIRRGVGYAIGVKAIGYSGGVDDTSTARVVVSAAGGEPVVSVHTAAAECGQGITTVQCQIASTELGLSRVVVLPADTAIGDAGSASASRLTWMSGGAVQGACRLVAQELLRRAAERTGRPAAVLALRDDHVVDATGTALIPIADLVGTDDVERVFEFHHRQTSAVDPETGQGDAHIAYAFAAHRAVVDVDVDLGLVKVVELATAQDVGKAMNPLSVAGQIEGGSAQGLGLALMEEILLDEHGRIRNPSFTDYLIPTILDVPSMPISLFEFPHPDSPYGLNGVGEPPTLSSTPAIVNALRAATGLELARVPVRPQDIALA
ncbi:xanthine dehydrogenase, molybdenum binding subunit apoprotein [Saccharopolyspora kobensis]|uniref:Xanthine dehydrogenase, molybdenum binding subunit apoprotein n=2 Tax=Saccharopolyspora kobensis TaxID=146035 RepID=A0A1H5UNG3_9PSEU|nr:xanthine dehydrogenase subunit D [Saccharopolyspora kobensis]SEF75978.1 xanthine dehydrogenase, molybdenum binding subunit apoprotein [Saccharopolyspora kobensis]SFC71986.1 xanthine dehydrogenase, molybdenum binding subunit apoprotein [Saccharopolyspora kobensis]